MSQLRRGVLLSACPVLPLPLSSVLHSGAYNVIMLKGVIIHKSWLVIFMMIRAVIIFSSPPSKIVPLCSYFILYGCVMAQLFSKLDIAEDTPSIPSQHAREYTQQQRKWILYDDTSQTTKKNTTLPLWILWNSLLLLLYFVVLCASFL